jgi:cytochrome c-type biogenesis protein CcmH
VTAFVVAALLLAVLAALFLAWPLLRKRPDAPTAPLAAVLAVLALILASAVLYRLIGNRGWTDIAAASQGSGSIPELARHLEADPQDQAGWMSLGEAYSEIGQYALALRAYERANRLSGGSNAAALAGMGESLLLSGNGARAEQASEYIERALQLDGNLPKALFYGAIIAYRQGHLDIARSRFAAMLAQSPPENVRAALQKEIDDIDAQRQSGARQQPGAVRQADGRQADGSQRPAVDAATAIHVHVTLAPALAGQVPANASLFVFVRSPDGGPPLAARRSDASLPQDVDLSAADSMIAGRSVSPGQSVSVIARISASGSPITRSGDLYGQIDYVAGKSGPRALQIDKLSP